MKTLQCLIGSLLLTATSVGMAGEIGFNEDFALSSDRAAALKQLIPGTEDSYYYHCLHYQNTEQYEKVEQTLAAWIKRYRYTDRVHEIINRQALLTYETSPEKTLARIRERLGLRFDHQRELLDRKPNLPTELDQNLISRETLTKRAFSRYQNLQGFTPAALDWLVGEELNPDRRRDLLSKLKRPDYPNLVGLVVDDLSYKHSGGFGSLGIHRQLLLTQLNECLKLKPDLLNQGNFVNTYLVKLQPNPDVDWRNNAEAHQAYLARLESFAGRLAPVHNSLKAHVLYHRLVFDRSQGEYNADRFLAYLKLPRPVGYIEPKLMQQEESRRHPCNLNADFRGVTLLPPVGSDEPLVQSYLKHFFVDAANYDAYTAYIRDEYLKHTFAETKIVHGLGDAEEWYSMLPPAMYQQLKERVDLDFAFTNKEQFSDDAPVSLDVEIKNVKTLIVKVFEINTGNYYREQRRELDTNINLDGLVANHETTHNYSEPPLRRVRRHFEFPQLDQRGVYVVDFIGGGKSSRALIRKGKLRHLVRTTTAGQVFTVLDEENKKLENASLWLAGHEYHADEDEEITVPFSSQPGPQAIVLSHDGFSSLDKYTAQSENYKLEAGIFVDRESLLQMKTAQVLVRPSLRLNGVPVTLSVLENVTLRLTSTDLDGISSSKEVDDFRLHEDRESTYEFQVPPRLSSIGFELQAKVENLSQGQKVDLSAGQSFTVNQIDKTDKVEDLHFSQIDGRYVVDVLGKTGEARADRPVQFRIQHRDFVQTVDVSLQTNAQGRVELGPLIDIVNVTATGPEGTSHTWPIRHDAHTYYSVRQGQAGETLTLPYMGDADAPQRDEFSLLELRGQTFLADRFKALAIQDGMLQIKGLPQGDYNLLLKRSGKTIQIRLADGATREGYVLGDHRYLQQRGERPLQIETIDVGEKMVAVKLHGASKFTRLHVFADRYQPAFPSFAFLGSIRDIEPGWRVLPSQRSAYIAGRNIGEEYRYIIDRKYAKKFPGNMLRRPSLLLNPWAIRTTETTTQEALEGESFGGAGGGFGGTGGKDKSGQAASATSSDFSDLNFLSNAAAVLVNLRSDEKGVVRIDRELLGPHQQLNFVAVDPLNTTFRKITLAETPRDAQDLRLIAGLDPEKHFVQQKQITVVGAKKPFEIDDITSSRFEMYDNLPGVYGLYMTLTGDAKLAEFSFILGWHNLEPEEQREKYSEFACHELDFFLMKKDPEFFKEVVKPYLANKKNKRFLDHWLLGEPVDEFLQPWNHAQLNIVEQILLAQRIKGEPQKTARYVNDRFNLTPPDLERFNHLFQTALRGSALETTDRLGIKGATEAAKQVRRLKEMKKNMLADMPAEPTAEAPAAPPAPDAAPFASSGRDRAELSRGRKALEKLAESNARPGSNAARKADFADADDEMLVEEMELAEAERGFYEKDAKRRANVRQFYRTLDRTKEWVENNYYKLPIEQQDGNLVKVNAFWNDYAAHDAKAPFYSKHVAQASHNFTEMMFALAVLDLPMEGEPPKTEFADAKMTLTPASPLIVFHEEILPAEQAAKDTPILVSQNFFRNDDRYFHDGNRRFDKYVTDEFLVHTVYGCQVVVTNPTSSPRQLDVLLQIPVGAIPVSGGRQTRSARIDLQPYQTQSIEYSFYFPAAGKFAHYPVQVSQNEELLAFAEPFKFNVVRKLSRIDTSSWAYLSQHGTEEEVVSYMQANNVQRINLAKIAWRMKDKAFFQKVIHLLDQRHAYNQTLWSYGVYHSNVPAIRQFLQHADSFVAQCGPYLVSPLLTIDPVVRKTYQQMEYRPLVNARAHQLGRQRQILNDRFFAQYERLMKILSYKRTLSDEDLMAVTYYMLLQDRVAEGIKYFSRVNDERLETRLQYDYFTAYLEFYKNDPQRGGAIAADYADYPVDRWRNAFANVSAQLKEIEGGAAAIVDKEDRDQQQAQLASSAPAFDFRVESRKIVLNHQNIKTARVNYYLMDIELLFSSKPFVQEFGGRFSFIKPNLTASVDVNGATTTIDLPKEFHNSNVLVEITAGGQTKSQAYYANSLNLRMIENYGQLQVTHAESGKPLSTVYVKTYARLKDGRIRFYKDGYTDLRGRFDYTSLSTNELDQVDRFSLLVLSQDDGAIVREAHPPKR